VGDTDGACWVAGTVVVFLVCLVRPVGRLFRLEKTEGPRIPVWDSAALEGAGLIVDQTGSLQGSSPRKAHIERCCCFCPFVL
jgi:hypothetical protein